MPTQPQNLPNKPQTANAQTAKKPDDKGNVTVLAHFKIFDPQTKQVYVEGRA